MTFKPLPSGYNIRRRGAPRINTLTEDDTDLVHPMSARNAASLIGTTVYNGRFATRIARFRHVVHDGKLVRARLNDGEEAAYPFERQRPTAAAVRSIVKGLMLDDARLILAPVEASYLETLFQLADDELSSWIEKNRRRLAQIIGLVPMAMLMKCVSQEKRTDGDIEAHHPNEWRVWSDLHTHRDPGGDTDGDNPQATGARLRRNAWVYNADRALRCTMTANQIRARATGDLPDAPELTLRNDRTRRELTNEDVATVASGESEESPSQ